MRRILLVLALGLVSGVASAQDFIRYYPPASSGSGTWDGGTITNPAAGPTGCTNPTYSFTVDTNAGLCATAANSILVQTAASGGSRALSIFTDALSGIRFYDAGSAITSFEATDDTATVYTNGVGRFVATNTYVGSLNATFRMYNGATNYSEFTPASTAAGRAVAVPDVAGTVQLNLAAGTAAPGATECDAANEVGRLYHQTGDPATVQSQLFRCTQTGPASYGWMPAGFQSGTAAPATCTTGNVFFDTDATAGSNWFGCTSANTWTLLGGGMADPGGNGIMARTAANTSVNRTLTAGEGVAVANGTGVAGDPAVSADRAVVVFKGTGTADPSASCGDTGDPFQLLDFYLETDTNEIYQCVAIDTWVLSSQLGDDKVIVGSGASAPAVETLPDCDDSGGNHLNYNTTGTVGSRFSCGTSGGSGSFDPTTAVFMEEFGGITVPFFQTFDVGSPSGANIIQQTGTSTESISVWNLTSGTADNTGKGFYFGAQNPVEFNDSNPWTIDMVLRLGTTSDLTESSIWFGVSASASGLLSASSGVWLRRDTDLSDTNFVAAVCDSSTNGCQAAGDAANQESAISSVSISDDTSYRLRVRFDPTGGPGSTKLIAMQVNDETEITFCSSTCTDTISQYSTGVGKFPIFALVSRGTTSKGVHIDYVRITMSGLVRY